MKKLLTRQMKCQFTWYRIVLLLALMLLIGIFSFNAKGQTTIIVGGSVNATISTPGEEDWYQFNATIDNPYSPNYFMIQAYGTADAGGPLDLVMYLYKSDYTLVDQDVNTGTTGIYANANIYQRLSVNALYYIKVSSSAIGSYTISVVNRGALPYYTTLSVNAPVYQKYRNPEGDVDGFRFLTGAAGVYTIQTYGSLDTYMSLYTNNMGSLLETDDNDGAGSNALISRSLSANTFYYVIISGTPAGPYTIDVVDHAPCALAVTPSNQNVPYSPAGSTTFSVTSDCPWTAVSDQAWCTVTPSGTGNGTITANYSVNTLTTSRTANITVTVTGLSPIVVTVTQAAAPCTLVVTPSNQNVPYSPAGSTTFSVTSNCSWTAVSNQTWCTVNPSGTGNGTITANYSVNTLPASRTANITVTVAGLSPIVVTVTQAAAPCTLTVTPSNQNVPYSPAGSTTFSVTSNCSWTAVSNQTWCTVNPSGTGNGTITANYSVNTLPASRTANITVTVAGLSPVVVTVTQAAAPCTLTVTPSNQNVPYSPAGSTTFSVTSNCSWTAVSNQTWCTVNPSGTGNGTITANYSVNTLPASRTANITVTVAGLSPVVVTVTQAAAPCTLTVTPSNQNVPYSPAGSTTFSVTSNCSWTAVSDQTWCTVTPSGTGNGTITANYNVNALSSSRTANITVTVAGLTPVVVTVTQAAAPCTLVVTPSNQNVPYSPAGSTIFTVTSNCAWTAVSDQTWCTVTPSGTGNGTITANYSVNTLTSSRTANITVTVAGLSPVVVTVTQAGVPCTLVVTPSNQNVPYSPAGSTTFSVTSNCSWNAVSDQTWCTVTLSGTGNGTITANYGVNNLTARTANITVTVAGLSPVVVTVTQAPAPCNTLVVAPPNQNVPYSPASSTTFSVTSNCSWTAVSHQTWCTVTPSGIGNGTITATYSLNESGATRMANITVTVSGLSPVEITLTQLGPPQQHFTPVWWPGMGMDHMNLYALTAKLDGVDLQPGDEIGIFDGNVCVGAGVLTQVLTGSNFLECLASHDDPDTPVIEGYTTGNAVSIKVWDSSEGSESSNTQITYISGEGIFNPGALATFNLTASTSMPVNINLSTGWNILSFAVEPVDMSMMVIVQPLITAGTLIKVQDENGLAIERLPDPIGWVDKIGQMSLTEGYKIKVTMSTTLNVIGRPRSSLYTIPLHENWNIIGYPFSILQSALPTFQPLINEGSLLKVQDEMGHAIEKLPDPIGWIDNIHNLIPGKGYKVKTNANTLLTISNASKGGYVFEKVAINQPSHFKPSFPGNGLDQMNLYLMNPTACGLGLKAGDEIGVFDEGLCVGAVAVDEMNREFFPIIVSVDDPTTPQTDGFTEGDHFELRLWDNEGGLEKITRKLEVMEGYTDLFEKQGTSVLKVDFEGVPHSSLGDAYPNPSGETTTFTFTLAAESRVRLEIFNAMGEVVKVLVNQNMTEGTHKVLWDNTSDDGTKAKAGIYFYRLVMNYFSQTKSLVIR